MPRINWNAVLGAAAVILLLAYRRNVAGFMQALRLGEMWREFCGIIWAMPPHGRYILTMMALGLVYVTAYFLVLNWIRR